MAMRMMMGTTLNWLRLFWGAEEGRWGWLELDERRWGPDDRARDEDLKVLEKAPVN